VLYKADWTEVDADALKQPAAAVDPAPAAEAPLDDYGQGAKSASAAPSQPQKKQPWDLKRIALHIARDCEGPALVRFVNTQELDPRSTEGKETKRAVANSATLLAVWDSGGRTGDPVACALTKYSFVNRYSMEVSKVSLEACPVIHRVNAPVLVAMSAKNPAGGRDRVEILAGDGRIQPAMVVTAMRSVLKDPKLDRIAQLTQDLDRNLAAVETLQVQIKTKQDMATQAKTQDKVAQLEVQIVELQKGLQAAQAKLDACQARITSKDS